MVETVFHCKITFTIFTVNLEVFKLGNVKGSQHFYEMSDLNTFFGLSEFT